jgi:hypothetical protein
MTKSVMMIVSDVTMKIVLKRISDKKSIARKIWNETSALTHTDAVDREVVKWNQEDITTKEVDIQWNVKESVIEIEIAIDVISKVCAIWDYNS